MVAETPAAVGVAAYTAIAYPWSRYPALDVGSGAVVPPVTSVTLPSGFTVTGDDEWDLLQRMYRHELASLSEGLCPTCAAPIDERGVCTDDRHRPCLWHICPDREQVSCSFLDVPPWPVSPGPAWPSPCPRCGTPR